MNATFPSKPRPLWLARSVWLGLVLLFLCTSCILEPFNLLGAPCAEDGDCYGAEVCIRSVCRPEGTPPPECLTSSSCDCGKQCLTSQQVCVEIVCRTDDECKRTNCDYHCDFNSSKCKQGAPPAPFCKGDEDCNGQICLDRRCSPCTKDEECVSTGRCDTNSGKCIACETNQDCAPRICDKASKKCVNCTSGTQCETRLCKDGSCSECNNDADCPTGRCDRASKKCLPCQKNSDCATQLCVGDICAECQKNSDCTNSGGNCSEGVCTSSCTTGTDCSSNFCKGGVCALCANDEECPSGHCRVGGRCAGPCNDSDAKCPVGRVCEAGICKKPGEGQACAPPLNCRSPFVCVDEGGGKICRSACSPLSPSCPSGQACQFLPNSTTPAGLCVSPNNGKAIGATCDPQVDECKTGLHCFKDTQGATCRKLCALQGGSPSCGSQEICAKINDKHTDIGACIVASCGTAGTFCKADEKCIDKQCKKTCSKDSDCDPSQFCFTSGNDMYCKEKECGYLGRSCSLSMSCQSFKCVTPANLPKTCSSVSDCGSSEYCLDIPGVRSDPTSNPKRCWKKCTTSSCPTGYHCVVTDLGTGSKACFPKIGGGETGAPCNDLTGLCETDHICVTTAITRSDPRCVPSCQPRATGSKCSSSSLECEEISSSTTFGICRNNQTSLSLNSPCGPHLGRCSGSTTFCFSSSLLKDKKSYCRRECATSSDCSSSSYTCRSFTITNLGTFKFCVPRN